MTKNKKPKRIKIKLVTTMCMACLAIYRTSRKDSLLCIKCEQK